jgi:nicotinamide-nucleotide adenylyltransferase
VQKRGKNKKTFPEYFTDSASGHVNYKNKLNLTGIKQNALRELEEEFGIPQASVNKIKFHELNIEKDNQTIEIAYVFIGLVDPDVKLIPDPQELDVKQSKFYKRASLERILIEDKAVDHSKSIWSMLLKSNIPDLFKADTKKAIQKKGIALFIGRFQPFHHGHVHVLKSVLKFHSKIKIGIGSSQLSNTKNDPFTSKERRQFIEAVMKKRSIDPKRYEIVEIPDIFDAKKWVNHVVSTVGEFSVVYSNSDWVRNLFLNKGYKLGGKLEIFKKKYNGTNVRKLMSKNDKKWTSLVPQEVVSLIKEFNGIERIRELYKADKN